MVYLTRKEQETTSAFVRRFMMRVQASGVLKEVKEKKFYKRPTNRSLRRVAALERRQRAIERARLRKLGRLK